MNALVVSIVKYLASKTFIKLESFQLYMPYKKIEDRRKCRNRWYANHSESEKQHTKRRKLEIKRWFQEYKSKLKCSKCSENCPPCLDFHHKEKKDMLIPQMVNGGYSKKRILAEIKKCKVLCANCHRKLHYGNV